MEITYHPGNELLKYQSSQLNIEKGTWMKVTDYFEVVSTKDRVFHLRLKGLWTDEVVAQITTPFLKRFKEVVDMMQGRQFLVLADTTEFRPPSQKTKAAIGQAMKYAREHNLYKTIEVLPSAVTRLAIQQAAQETGNDDFRIVVSSVEEGWAEINRLKQHLA